MFVKLVKNVTYFLSNNNSVTIPAGSLVQVDTINMVGQYRGQTFELWWEDIFDTSERHVGAAVQ